MPNNFAYEPSTSNLWPFASSSIAISRIFHQHLCAQNRINNAIIEIIQWGCLISVAKRTNQQYRPERFIPSNVSTVTRIHFSASASMVVVSQPVSTAASNVWVYAIDQYTKYIGMVYKRIRQCNHHHIRLYNLMILKKRIMIVHGFHLGSTKVDANSVASIYETFCK
jgi:hypothetical protein